MIGYIAQSDYGCGFCGRPPGVTPKCYCLVKTVHGKKPVKPSSDSIKSEILRLHADNIPNRAIATQLQISDSYVSKVLSGKKKTYKPRPLKPSTRKILRLYDAGKLSGLEIAKRVGLSGTRVYMVIARFRKNKNEPTQRTDQHSVQAH